MKLDKVFIVKVQVPLATNGEPEAMIYNKDRSFQTFVPIDVNILRFMNGRYKEFCRSGLKGKDFYLGTESEVPDPGW